MPVERRVWPEFAQFLLWKLDVPLALIAATFHLAHLANSDSVLGLYLSPASWKTSWTMPNKSIASPLPHTFMT